MGQFLIYIMYTILIYIAIMTIPHDAISAVLCVIFGLMAAMWDYIQVEVVG